MDVPAPLIFLGLFLIIPLQIAFSPERTSDMDYYLKDTITIVRHYWDRLRGVPPEEEAAVDFMASDEREDEEIDADDIEANGYYGLGHIPRDPRPPHVKYRVGDVVFHHNQFRGVIIGWDEKENAPERWLKAVRSKTRDANQANYAVLIDTRSRLIPQLAYVQEENLTRAKGRVIHPLVDKYFEGKADESRYRMRPLLRKIYPND